MTEGDIETVPPPTVCKVCMLPMPSGARKCAECSSWQDWRSHVTFGSTLLSLLVALVSVLTFAVPIWKTSLTPDVHLPAPVLLDINEGAEATFVVTNAGKLPTILEYLVMGTNDAVLSFDMSGMSPHERVIEPNRIGTFRLRLAVEHSEVDVWDLVQLNRTTDGCRIQAGVISPNGERTKSIVDVSMAGLDEPPGSTNLCARKLKKLALFTVRAKLVEPGFEEVLCRVTTAHPKDPANPSIGTECLKYLNE